MHKLIAYTIVKSVSPTGDEYAVAIGVGAPVRQETGEYGCDVMLPPANDVKVIYGEDSLQCLSLALRFFAEHINDLLAREWKIVYPDSSNSIPFGAYLVHPGWISRLEAIGRQRQEAGQDVTPNA